MQVRRDVKQIFGVVLAAALAFAAFGGVADRIFYI